MAKRTKINWSTKVDFDVEFMREQIVDAYLARLLSKHKQLSKREIELLKQFSDAISGLIQTLNRNEELAEDLKEMIELAWHAQAERSDVKVEDTYSVYYGEQVEGIASIQLSRNDIKRISGGRIRGVGCGVDTLASKSYNLLVGEIYQFAAKKILESMTILGYKVVGVKRLDEESKLSKIIGRRVDDWKVVLANGLELPAEVKSSRGNSYFRSAFDQIKNSFGKDQYALFVGFFLDKAQINCSAKVAVVLVDKSEGLGSFCSKVKRLISEGDMRR